MTAAFLLVLVCSTQTSTVPEWARPAVIPGETSVKEDREPRERRRRAEQSELEHLERQYRWSRDRNLRFALHGGSRFSVADASLFGVDAALGFSLRLARSWTLQARAVIGTGYGLGRLRIGGPFDGTRDDSGPLLDSGIDATIRIGGNRFYFGLGPFGRAWKIFAPRRELELVGGVIVEYGWWLGDDRQIDLNLRFFGAAFEDGSALAPFIGTSFGVGWIL